jgi:hypothetical protein
MLEGREVKRPSARGSLNTTQDTYDSYLIVIRSLHCANEHPHILGHRRRRKQVEQYHLCRQKFCPRLSQPTNSIDKLPFDRTNVVMAGQVC